MGDQYHEPAGELSDRTRDLTRVLVSLKEEVEAIDWYNQRIELAGDEQVKRLLRHNQVEEMEHAAMALEHLRRTMPGWDDALRTYLFTEGDLTDLEHVAMGRTDDDNPVSTADNEPSSDGAGGPTGNGESSSDGGPQAGTSSDNARGLGIGSLKGGNE